jgi:hypothetical protein
MLKLEATSMLDHCIFEYRDLSEGTMHVETYDPHLRLPDSKYAGADGPHDNYGSALAAQPGKSRGQPDNNTSSQLIVRNGLPVACAPDTLIPVPKVALIRAL